MDESMAMDRIGAVIERYGRDLLEDPDRLQQLLEAEGPEGREWFFPFVLALRTALEMGYEMPVDSAEGVFVAQALQDRFGVEKEKALWGASALAVLSRRFYGTSSEAVRSRGHSGGGRVMIGPLTPSQALWAAMVILWIFAALSFGVYRMMADRRPDGGEFRVTLLAPLSGPEGPVGQVMLRAAQMAAEQINSQGGVKGYRVRLLGFDAHDPSGPPWEEVGGRMKERTRPHLVLCAAGDEGALGLVGWSERTRTPVIAVDAKDPQVPAVSPYKPNPFMFAMLASPAMEGRLAAYFVRQGLNRTGAFLVFDGSSRRSVEAERRFEASFSGMGGQVFGRVDVSSGGNGSVVPSLEMGPGGPQAVVAFLSGDGLARLFKGLRSKGFAGPLVALGSPEGFGRDLKFMVNSWWIADASPGDVYVQPFLKAYAEKYKDRLSREMVLPAMLAYDSMRWAGDALSRASAFSPEGIRYALSDTKSLSLVHATLSVDPSTHAPYNKAMALIYVGPHGAAFQRRIWMGPR
ncbi:MAG: ABC transporter substrate-binding protein [Thermanaerothrix sp.]|nr:ABC transporter substrate-binding protein [Thermanaerothrix sp.]